MLHPGERVSTWREHKDDSNLARERLSQGRTGPIDLATCKKAVLAWAQLIYQIHRNSDLLPDGESEDTPGWQGLHLGG